MAAPLHRSVGFWGAAGVLAAVVGIGIALWFAPATVELPAPATPDTKALSTPFPAPPSMAMASAGAPVQAVAPTTPPGVSDEAWRGLQQELAGRPEELQRLADYFVFADQLQRFRALPGGASADRLALARALDGGLDQRLRLRELSAAEARLIKIAVVDVLLGDDEQRRAAVADWEATVAAAAPSIEAVNAAARNAEFQRRQAQIVAAWSATAPALRDAGALERDLDALRRSSFNPPR